MERFRQAVALVKRLARAEHERDEADEHAGRQDAGLAQVRRAYSHEKAVGEVERKGREEALREVLAVLAKVAEVAKLERELAIARTAGPEFVACSGCGLEVTTRSMAKNGANRYHVEGPSICGEWRKDGKPWRDASADVADQQTEVGE